MGVNQMDMSKQELTEAQKAQVAEMVKVCLKDLNKRYKPYWETIVKPALENDPDFIKAVAEMRRQGYSDKDIAMNAYNWGMAIFLRAESEARAAMKGGAE